MKFAYYNDYELLFLISEGSEPALILLYQKYEALIYKLANSFYPYGDKRDDLIQEGRILLFDCIYRYNTRQSTSFYSYFLISLRRTFQRKRKSSYYDSFVFLEDEKELPPSNSYKSVFDDGKRFFTDPLEISIYNECYVGGMSLKAYAANNNLDYSRVYYKSKIMASRLKKLIDY